MKKTKSYYRKITERLPQGDFGKHVAGYGILFLSVLFVFLSLLVVFAYSQYERVSDQRLKDTNNLAYWEQVAEIEKNSPDVYYEVALYSARVGDRTKAQSFINKALQLDPEFERARLLEQEIKITP